MYQHQGLDLKLKGVSLIGGEQMDQWQLYNWSETFHGLF